MKTIIFTIFFLAIHLPTLNACCATPAQYSLSTAIKKGLTYTVQNILAEPHTTQETRDKSLRAAARHNQLSIVNLLLKTGAHPNAQKWHKIYLDHGLKEKKVSSPCALVIAASHNNVPMIKALLTAGADPNGHVTSQLYNSKKIKIHQQSGPTALTIAAIKGNSDMARMLIDHGAHLRHFANYDLPDGYQKGSPLDLAIAQDSAPIVELLIDEGVTTKNALVRATQAHATLTIQLLILRSLFLSDELAKSLKYAINQNYTQGIALLAPHISKKHFRKIILPLCTRLSSRKKLNDAQQETFYCLSAKLPAFATFPGRAASGIAQNSEESSSRNEELKTTSASGSSSSTCNSSDQSLYNSTGSRSSSE